MAVDAKAMETINSWSREVTPAQAERVLNEYSAGWLKANKEAFPEPYKSAAELIIRALDIPIDTSAAKPAAKKSARPKGYDALVAAINAATISKQTIHAACVAGEITEAQKTELYALVDSKGKPSSKAPTKVKAQNAVPAQWARTFKIETLKAFEPLAPDSPAEEVWKKLKEMGEAAGVGKLNKAWIDKFAKEIIPLYGEGWADPVAPAVLEPTVINVDTTARPSYESAEPTASIEDAAIAALAIPDLSDL